MKTVTTLMALGWISVVVSAIYFGEKAATRQEDASKVTVVYWEKWTGQEGDAVRKIVDKFNKSQDKIFVKYLSISGVDQKTMLATAGSTPPDIAGIWLEQLAQFSDAGALTDLTDLAKDNGLTADYYVKPYWDSLNYRGRLWALPSTPSSIALHVRSDKMPESADTPEEFPKTIEGLDELAIKMAKKNPDGTLEFAGFMPSSPGWWNWAWGNFFGGNLWDGEKISINSPEMVRAFEWIKKYAKVLGSKEVQSFQSGFGNFASPQDPFMTGKTGMELNGVWKANFIDVYAKGIPWFAVPFPHPADRPELSGHTQISQDILTIPRGAKHPKEAFEFIRFWQRQEIMEQVCSEHGKNSPLNVVSEKFNREHKNTYIKLFDQLARSPKAFASPQIGIWKQISAEINVAFQEVNTLSKEPKQALDDAQKRIDGLWKTYQDQVLADAK